jgi:3-dehydroquinate synthase
MLKCSVPLGASSSTLLVGNGCRKLFSQMVRQEVKRFVVLSDENVKKAHEQSLLEGASWLSVPAGEASKDIAQAIHLWSELIRLKLDRSSAVVAVGGGVVGDLAGFVASTFLRGVPFYSVPTSLLAMVDASVGGKVGIDLPEGKNLVGQFYPARVVAVDPELLSTLPLSEWSSGMAEVIKHGILSGPDLWSEILSFGPENRSELERLTHLVTKAVGVKVDVVTQDPYEKTGIRATLNLGHSYGHAIEWCSGYRLSHGEAVGLGLLAGARLSKALGILKRDFESELLAVLRKWQLPTVLPSGERYGWERVSQALDRDKKNKDGRWCFVLPVSIGQVETVRDAPRSAVREAFLGLKGATD